MRETSSLPLAGLGIPSSLATGEGAGTIWEPSSPLDETNEVLENNEEMVQSDTYHNLGTSSSTFFWISFVLVVHVNGSASENRKGLTYGGCVFGGHFNVLEWIG